MTRDLFIRDAIWPVSTKDRNRLGWLEKEGRGLTYLAIEEPEEVPATLI